MRWSKGWIAVAGVVSVAAAVGGTAFAMAGSGAPASQSSVAGKEVCAGKPLETVAISGQAGVLSDQFPLGTALRVTNLANSRSVTLSVVGSSAGCAVLNSSAFEVLRSPDAGRGGAESVLRRVRVEIVGNAPAPAAPSTARVRASGIVGQVVCDGASVGLVEVGGAAGAFSSQLPIGTSVRVTNLESGRQVTVRVVGVGTGCVVLNSAAFGLVGESGKSVIKRVQIEKVK